MNEYTGEIIETGKALLREGLVLGTWGNISTRLISREGFLITPSGIPYSALNPEDIVLVDDDGRKIGGRRRPSSETLLHAAIYRRRPDVCSIIHTHSPYASVFAVNRREIPPILEEMAQILNGGVRVAAYALPGARELADSACIALQDRPAVLLANHGLVGVGESLRSALLICRVVEKAAHVFLLAKQIGDPYVFNEKEINEIRRNFLTNYGQQAGRDD